MSADFSYTAQASASAGAFGSMVAPEGPDAATPLEIHTAQLRNSTLPDLDTATLFDACAKLLRADEPQLASVIEFPRSRAA